MIAYWINATTKTIEQIEWAVIEDLHKLIGGYLEVNKMWPSRDVLYCDEEYLMKTHRDDAWFLIAGKEQPIGGNGAVVGPEHEREDESWTTLDPVITLDQLRAEVTFLEPAQVAAWAKANSSEWCRLRRSEMPKFFSPAAPKRHNQRRR